MNGLLTGFGAVFVAPTSHSSGVPGAFVNQPTTAAPTTSSAALMIGM
jgi:hypothetical protein